MLNLILFIQILMFVLKGFFYFIFNPIYVFTIIFLSDIEEYDNYVMSDKICVVYMIIFVFYEFKIMFWGLRLLMWFLDGFDGILVELKRVI